MCGIFAAVKMHAPFAEGELENFRSACNIIAHRGPDAEGFFTAQTEEGGQGINLFLGHRRLSIIDLEESSNQPFERDGITVVYNGEIFNYIELREELRKDFTFTTEGDTEVVLRAYQKWGLECFKRFNGMWALAIYDRNQNKLVVSRDRFSIKPLYVMRSAGAVYFASEIKQIKKIQPSLTPSPEVICAFLQQGLLDHRPETFFREIKRFPSMHALELDITTGDENLKQYWDFAEGDEDDVNEPPADRFKMLLIDSLRLRLRSDVPIGTLLSGGLDSSAISCIIQQHINPDLSTFSVVSDSKKYSEEPYIDLLISENGLKNHKLRFDDRLAFDHIDKVLSVQDEPYGSLAVVAQYLLFQKIKKETGIKVLLSGQGADEILLGYNKFFFLHLRSLLKQGNLLSFARMAGASFINGTTLRAFDLSQAKRYMPGRISHGLDYLTGRYQGEPLWAFENMRSRQILDINRYSVPALAHYEDRNSMAASVEVRLPFLDFRLVNFLVNLPTEHKLRGGWTKFVLRESVSEMPKKIRWRKDKKGFTTPEDEWMRGELGRFIDDYMSSHHALQDMGLVDNTQFRKAITAFRGGKSWLNHGDLFRVFITEKWLNS